MSHSLTARLGLGLTAGLVAVFALQWLLVTLAIRHAGESYLRTRLEHDLEAILAALAFDTDGRLRLAEARLGPIYRQPFSGHYFRIDSGTQQLRSRSLWDTDFTLPAASAELARLIGPRGQPLLVLTRRYRLQDQAVTVSVAEELTALEDEIARFGRRYAVVSLGAFIVLIVLQTAVVRFGLRGVQQLRDELDRLEHGELVHLSEKDVPTEVQPLVQTLNRLLEALRSRLERSRAALGNLAHALKTPLTLLADLATHETLRRLPQIRRRLATQTETMRRHIERELARARLAGSGTPGQWFDAAKDIPALLATLAALYRERHLVFERSLVGPDHWPAEREDMLELLGNLLDNACKWARCRVRLAVRGPVSTGTTRGSVPRNGALVITVEDDGPGVPKDARAHLAAQRGQRLDEVSPGHGLGLAIVRDIVRSYGGQLDFERSPLGGLRVAVRLPLGPRRTQAGPRPARAAPRR